MNVTADELLAIAERIDQQAATSERAGQMDELEAIADEVRGFADRLVTTAGLVNGALRDARALAASRGSTLEDAQSLLTSAIRLVDELSVGLRQDIALAIGVESRREVLEAGLLGAAG